MEPHLTATECHLPYGSHSVTFHLTQVNTPHLNPSQPDRPVLDSPTPERWKAELT